MARYTGPVCRLCRREGEKLFLKGERCYSDKCSVGRRSYAPGQHGQGRKKNSEYATQFRMKQKAKRYYGLLENQFHMYFLEAERRQGVTGENLLRLLESRLDNVVYRLGFASSRKRALPPLPRREGEHPFSTACVGAAQGSARGQRFPPDAELAVQR